MIEKVGDLLPIGTVVMLKNGTKKLMVFGIIQSVQENPDQEYDYIGVPYPEGNMGQDYQYLFNHADVDQVFFRGFEDVDRQEFIYNLVEFYKKRNQ
ncbi:MAG: DUF4176 domain-containing protein [Clostridia bacterium]|nr:DUF4176 domain-containing protein [Clostridia bacterium]